MSSERHPIPRRPIGAILEARRREKAALAARCRSFGMIAEAMAYYARERGPAPTGTPCRGRWEQLGDYAGGAASMDGTALRAASEGLRHAPAGEASPQDLGAVARSRDAAQEMRLAEARP